MRPDSEGPISLETRMAFVLAAYFGGLFLLAYLVGTLAGIGTNLAYAGFAAVFIGFLSLGSAALFEGRLKVRWPEEADEPRLHAVVQSVARKAKIPTPKVGVSFIYPMNAFAFGRSHRDGRVCISRRLLDTVDDAELRAVVAHEMCHIRSWDMTVISLLSVVPTLSDAIVSIPDVLEKAFGNVFARILMWIVAVAITPVVWLVWLAMIPVSWLSTVLANYGSRVRELAADTHAVLLDVQPNDVASALFKVALDESGFIEVQGLSGARRLFLCLQAEAYDQRWML